MFPHIREGVITLITGGGCCNRETTENLDQIVYVSSEILLRCSGPVNRSDNDSCKWQVDSLAYPVANL